MKRQSKDKIFELLYKDLREEMEGAMQMHVNDRYGWDNWYKQRLLTLCVEYSIKTKGNDEAS